MKITILQTDIIWKQKIKNFIEAERLMSLDANLNSDVFVLPEMWSTGFVTEPSGVAECATDSLSLKWMIRMASKYDAAICGSLPIYIQDNDTGDKMMFNRHYFVKPDGHYEEYDKRHLFRYGGEDKCYSSGYRRTIVQWRNFRFLLLTCYDLRFPTWSRCHEDYDAIISVANWPDSRSDAWYVLTKARAIENQCYMIGCNRVGYDEKCHYLGQSLVVNPKGVVLCEADSTQMTITANLDLDELKSFRTKFPVLKDRDIIH